MKKQILSFIFLVTIVSTSVYGVSSKKYQPVFPLGEFSRPSGINPILSFDPTSVFFRPMKNALIRREESDAFNPGAVVKNGKVYIFYRTEDNPAVGLGKRTSRVALAESYDGRFLDN
ncbi:MAG: Beta-xylosidase [Bacteroidetes bacterium]|nr:Beta-xylosidase [Bacteroidota bacterium]